MTETIRAASEGINTAGGLLVPTEFLSVLYSVLEQRGVIRATADVQPIGRDVASISKVLTNLSAYFVGEGTAPTASQPVLTSLSLVAKKISVYSIASSELEEDSLIDFADMIMTLAANAFALQEDTCGCSGDV